MLLLWRVLGGLGLGESAGDGGRFGSWCVGGGVGGMLHETYSHVAEPSSLSPNGKHSPMASFCKSKVRDQKVQTTYQIIHPHLLQTRSDSLYDHRIGSLSSTINRHNDLPGTPWYGPLRNVDGLVLRVVWPDAGPVNDVC